MQKFGLLFFAVIANWAQAQFAPAAGKPNSTAIKNDSTCFVAWAMGAELQRGLKQINLPDSGYASVGTEQSALGPALKNGVVSLGDGGSIILEFNPPILDANGWDFAVFENSFNDTFLELAFVEVSSDKQHWVRFPAVSLTQTQQQTPSFGFTQPEHLNHLAGKYRSPYGTPFDLSELKDSQYYSPMVKFVRLVDVVGSIDSAWGSRDSRGHLVNDPFPTPFISSGFDLDAVGVIHQGYETRVGALGKTALFFPNPSKNKVYTTFEAGQFCISNFSGQILLEGHFEGHGICFNLPAGAYIMTLSTDGQNQRGVLTVE